MTIKYNKRINYVALMYLITLVIFLTAISLNLSIDVYADDDPVQYTISYYDQGSLDGISYSGSLIEDSYTHYYVGEGLSQLPEVNKEGFVFKGWYDSYNEGNKVTSISETEEGDILLYARWEVKGSIFISVEPQQYTYDGSSKNFIIKGSELEDFIIEYLVNYSYTQTVPINVGKYNVRITREEDSFNGAFSTIIVNGLVILKQKVAIPEIDTTNFIYDGNEKIYNIANDERYVVEGNVKTEVGRYIVNIDLKDTANFEWQDGSIDRLSYNFIIGQNQMSAKISTFSEKEDVIVRKNNGFAPGMTVKINKIDTQSVTDIQAGLKLGETIVRIYDIKLMLNNVSVSPNDTLIMRVLIPTECFDSSFRILHVHGNEVSEVEYYIDADKEYVVITTDSLSEFMFVNTTNSAMTTLIIILLCLLLLLEAAIAVNIIVKKRLGVIISEPGTFTFAPLLLITLILAIEVDAIIGLSSSVLIGLFFIVYLLTILSRKKAQLVALKTRALEKKSSDTYDAREHSKLSDNESVDIDKEDIQNNQEPNEDESVLSTNQNNGSEALSESINNKVLKEELVTDESDNEEELDEDEEEFDDDLEEKLDDEENALEEEESDSDIDEGEEPYKILDEETGLEIFVKYRKSFTAKMIQTTSQNKKYYNELKNAILSYKKTKSRISWKYDSINSGRLKFAKFKILGKTLYLYLALDPKELSGTKYKVKTTSKKLYEGTPCVCRIKNERRFKYALELIELAANKHGLVKGNAPKGDYYLKRESTDSLIKRGLIIDARKD